MSTRSRTLDAAMSVEQLAYDWETEHADEIVVDAHVRARGGMPYSAVATVTMPNPAAPDLTITMDVEAPDVPEARIDAQRAVRAITLRHFADPAASTAAALRERDGLAFTRDALGEQRVSAAVQAAGGRAPTLREVDAAILHARMVDGITAPTIAQVASAVRDHRATVAGVHQEVLL